MQVYIEPNVHNAFSFGCKVFFNERGKETTIPSIPDCIELSNLLGLWAGEVPLEGRSRPFLAFLSLS